LILEGFSPSPPLPLRKAKGGIKKNTRRTFPAHPFIKRIAQYSSSSGDSKNKVVHLGFPYPFYNGPLKVPLFPLFPFPPPILGNKVALYSHHRDHKSQGSTKRERA